MPVDCPYPTSFDILQIYGKDDILDKEDRLLMELPLCEVIKGDVENIDKDIIKMKSIESGEVIPYKRSDFLLEIQDSFQRFHIQYAEIILAKDQTKIRI